ncbi:hypothetical protein NMG60_11036608 [Bertholletia excelsa]
MSHLGAISLRVSNLNHLKQLHAQIIHTSLHHSNYWVAQLISHCTRLHAPRPYTLLIFHSTPEPNSLVFTNMLKFYSRLRSNSEVINIFYQMQNNGVKLDVSGYPVLIKSAGDIAVVLHGYLLKLGFGCDRFVRNAMMDAYAKYGQVGVARKLFDEMCARTVADWNSMISGYWNWGCEEEACKLFEIMPQRNVISWTAMVTGYSKMRDLKKARRYFDEMPKKNVVSWNAMISGYAQNGLAEEALELFNEMMNMGFEPNEATWISIISSCASRGDPGLADSLVKMMDEKCFYQSSIVKTALLDMHAKCGSIERAEKIFIDLGVCKNSIAWNTMISAYTRLGDLTSARELLNKMPEAEKDVISWNSMIAGYAQNGQSAKAIQLFQEMVSSKGSKADEVTMVSVLSACGNLGALEIGNWVVDFLIKNKIKLSISGYNTLIFMYSRGGSMKDAKEVFQEMPTRDVVSYNTLITGFAAHGHANEALELMLKMKEEGINPDRVTYIGVLTACSHAGLLEEGHKIFGSIKKPDVDHYACMVDLLGRVGKLDEATTLIETMPMRPHGGIYGSLLNASRIHKRIDLGELAANKLFELEPQNSGNYILLSNLYASKGRWEDVERIRNAMKEGGVIKTAGWSWVVHGCRMHEFVSGDRSHEKSDDIYRLLEELRKKMKAVGYVSDKSCALRDVEEEEKEEMVGFHSEKLAVTFALLVSEAGAVIRVVKNLRICWDCHVAIKMISKLEGREIIVRDNNRFHHFSNGVCSCNEYW